MARSRFENLDEQKRERILREAGEEFAEKGYAQASLNAIIERAGISKGSLYYYFENKEDVFDTVVDAAVEQLAGPLSGIDLEELDEETFWSELQEATLRLMAFLDDHRWYVQLARGLYRIRDTSGGDGPTNRVWEMSRRLARSFLERGREVGAVRDDMDLELMVEMSMSVGESVDRWVLERFDEMDSDELEDLTVQIMGMYKRMLAPRQRLSEEEL